MPGLLPRGAAIPPFYVAEIGWKAMRRAREGLLALPMHIGEPTAGIPARARAVAHDALDQRSSGYWHSHALCERIAHDYREQYGVDVAPERILLTGGASAGLVAVFAALFAVGDRVGLARPGYAPYRNALQALGRVPVDLDCGAETDYRLLPASLDGLAELLHGLIVASPANPTGAMLDRAQLDALFARCRADGTRIVSDEIYHGIAYGTEAVTALALDPEAIVVNSFSKRFRMPGWRLGWLVAPEACVERLSAYLINFFLTPTSVSQHAALAAFDDTAELEASVVGYAANRARLIAALPALGLSAIAPPDGAFYLYADVGHLTDDSISFAHRLLDETGVAIAPGIDFDPVDGHRFVRFSFALSASELEQAIDLLVPWFARQPRRDDR